MSLIYRKDICWELPHESSKSHRLLLKIISFLSTICFCFNFLKVKVGVSYMYYKHVWFHASLWNIAVPRYKWRKVFFLILRINFPLQKCFSNMNLSYYANTISPKLTSNFYFYIINFLKDGIHIINFIILFRNMNTV